MRKHKRWHGGNKCKCGFLAKAVKSTRQLILGIVRALQVWTGSEREEV